MTTILGITRAFSHRKMRLHPSVGDRTMCDTCTLAPACERYSEGSVCSVEKTENNRLSTYFTSRRGLNVIDGVASVIELQAKLLEADLDELDNPKFRWIDEDESITAAKKAQLKANHIAALQKRIETRMNSLVKNGGSLAKLRDPSLNRPAVSFTLNAAAGVGSSDYTQRQISQAIDVLESQGYPRESITEQMAYGLLDDTDGHPTSALPAGTTIVDSEGNEQDDDDF